MPLLDDLAKEVVPARVNAGGAAELDRREPVRAAPRGTNRITRLTVGVWSPRTLAATRSGSEYHSGVSEVSGFSPVPQLSLSP